MPVFIAIAANTEHNKNGQTITSVPVVYSRCVQEVGAVPVILPPAGDETWKITPAHTLPPKQIH